MLEAISKNELSPKAAPDRGVTGEPHIFTPMISTLSFRSVVPLVIRVRRDGSVSK
jgi:hypothetical protein